MESLSVLADGVTRVVKVGTERQLGVQARVANVGGTWKHLTGGINVVAAAVNLFVPPS